MKRPIIAVAAALTVSGCAPLKREAAPYSSVATIQELMLTQVDPSADFLWAAVASTSRDSGYEERQPRTDEEWKVVRTNALTLVEATNLLMMPGRRVAAPGQSTADADLPGIEPPAKIQKAIDADRAAFIRLAQGLRATGLHALAAADRRDAQALFDAGGDIDKACEYCHRKFWYPPPAEKSATAAK
jgi:hypothetical protein